MGHITGGFGPHLNQETGPWGGIFEPSLVRMRIKSATSCVQIETKMEERVKTVLVNFGENRRIVSFSSVPAPTTDAEALAKAIKETFSDILKPEQDFFLQVKTDESGAWGGVFIDVLKQEIVDKAVINVVIIQKPIQEVSHCAFLNIKSIQYLLVLFDTGHGVYAPSQWT